MKWFADIGASTSGSKQELTIRINRLSRYPGLARNSRQSQKKLAYFSVVLIPWIFHRPQSSGGHLTTICPRSTIKFLLSMFPWNWKVVLVSRRKRYKCLQVEKTLVNEQVVYVKAMIKKVLRVHATSHSYYVWKWNTNQSSLLLSSRTKWNLLPCISIASLLETLSWNCGFFEDPSDSNYGASPDALAASSLIFEDKTRQDQQKLKGHFHH